MEANKEFSYPRFIKTKGDKMTRYFHRIIVDCLVDVIVFEYRVSHLLQTMYRIESINHDNLKYYKMFESNVGLLLKFEKKLKTQTQMIHLLCMSTVPEYEMPDFVSLA